MGFFRGLVSWINSLTIEAQRWRSKMRNGTDPYTRLNSGTGMFNITTIFPDDMKLFRSKEKKKATKG